MVMACCICAKECLPFNPQRSFHRIPTNEQMRYTWFNIIGRPVSHKWARVCSDHFTENDFHEMSIHSKVRRLKNTAVPTIGIRNRKNKNKESSLFQETNVNVSEIEFQNDSEIEYQNEKDVIYCSTENFEEDNTNSDAESKERKDEKQESSVFQETNVNVSEIESQNDFEIEYQNEKDVIYCSTENFEEDNTNGDVESKEIKDEKQESSVFQETNVNVSEIESQNDFEIEYQNKKDVIYCSTENFEEDNTNSDVEYKESKNVEKSSPILNITENVVNVSLNSEREINTIFINNQKEDDNFVNKNSISVKRKLRFSNLENSKLRKIFVRMSRYNIECFRRIDFFSDKKWLAFTRYVAYNRYQTKILTQQNRRLQKKIYVLQDMMEDLMKS